MLFKAPVIFFEKQVLFPGFDKKIKLDNNESQKVIDYLDSSKISLIDFEGDAPFTAYDKREQYFIISYANKEINNKGIKIFGTLVQLKKVDSRTDENTIISLKGIDRVLIKNWDFKSDIPIAEGKLLHSKNINTKKALELQDKIIAQLDIFKENSEIQQQTDMIQTNQFYDLSPEYFADAIAMHLFSPLEKKLLFSLIDVEKRLERIHDLLQTKFDMFIKKQIREDTSRKVREKLTKQQREFYLKEELKVISDELNTLTGAVDEIDGLRKEVESKSFPPHIKEKLLLEIRRLEQTPSQAADANVLRTYIEWLIKLPYTEKDHELIDIKAAKKGLDKDHYGLKKPKDRIIEYLAVKQSNPHAKGPILCLVGPPGVGKTTLAISIAKALDRKFVKISLGGLRDEAEIRGHRRTYIASMPGKIIQAMRKAKVINPVILLDEIDKMSADFKGDPTAAMLEVLDFEQNRNFQDHFIEEEYDLSNVMFIATANYYRNIPEALIDRVEVVDLNSYTELEKVNIATTHLIPQILEDTRIPKDAFKWDEKALKFIIRHYTMEAGVRQLRRTIDQVARKLIVKEFQGIKYKKTVITTKKIVDLLGNEIFDFTKKDKKPQIGVTQGLAWTQYGGDILPIEAIIYKGKGELVLTGQLKEVMRESAGIAISYIRANAEEFNVPFEIKKDEKKINIFKNNDIHIHSPDGATPKDGPSAGVTFTTSLISALSKKPVSQDIGMTGEITLRGMILPIGGLKEKLISAHRSGLKKIFIPLENKKDLKEIPKEVTGALEIIPVKDYKEIYKQIFN